MTDKHRIRTILDKKAWLLLAALVVLGTLSKALSVIFPLIEEQAIDAGVAGKPEQAAGCIVLLCIAGAVNGMADMLDQVMEAKYSNHICHTYRKKIAAYIGHLEPEAYAAKEKSEYVSVFNNNISMVVNNYYISLLNIMRCAMAVLFTVSALLTLNGTLAWIIIVTSILTIAAPFVFKSRLNSQNNAINSALKTMNARLDDFLNGYLTGRVFHALGCLEKRLVDSSAHLAGQQVRYWKLMQEPNAVTVTLAYGRDILLVGSGVFFMMQGTLTVGALFAAIQLANLLAAPAVNISYLISNVTAARDMKRELDGMCQSTETSGEGKSVAEGVKNAQIPPDIELRDLSFSYGNKAVLRGINLHFEAGKKYLLVGESGSGKSSLLKLLAGMEQNYQGMILVDGKEMRSVNGAEWYKRIAAGFQESILFHDTLYNNMTLWKSLSDEGLESCLEELNLSELVKRDGMQNDCSNGGDNYSGGERQRIALVRVLLEKRGLILADEATSALDPANAQRVEKLLLHREGCTVINIAHKVSPDTLGLYDGIVLLRGGEAAAFGGYEQLIEEVPEFLCCSAHPAFLYQ